MTDSNEDLTTAYMLGKHDGRKEAEAANSRCPASAGYVFIVFSKSGKPKAVGQNAEEAWRQLAGETMRWQFWRNLYRTQYGYFGKRVSLT